MNVPIEIFEVKSYCTENGMEVKALISLTDSTKIKHSGSAIINISGRLAPIDFPFEDGLTLKQCFEGFEEAINKFLKEMQDKQREENLIVKPNSGTKLKDDFKGFQLV